MKGKDNIWEDLGYPDMDMDGDVDIVDAILFDELTEIVSKGNTDILDDEEDDDVDYSLEVDNNEEIDDFIEMRSEANEELIDCEDCDDIDDEDLADDEEEIVETVEINIGEITVNNSLMEDAEDNEYEEPCLDDKVNYASADRNTRISPDFIMRNAEEEKRIGIKDMNFYCYWMPDFEAILLVCGELVSDIALKGQFALKAEIYDQEGDLIEVAENFSYTGGSGFVVRNIMPEIFFNRYPFSFEFHFDERVPKRINIVPDLDEEEDEEVERGNDIVSAASLNIEDILSQQVLDAPLFIAHMNKGDKIPKSLVHYIVEDYIGKIDLKCVFFKEHESDGEYWANQLAFTTIINGKVKERSLLYYLFYNEKNEMIGWTVKDIWDKKYNNKTSQDFINLPPSEKCGRIIVYLGVHPSNCSGRTQELVELEKGMFK